MFGDAPAILLWGETVEIQNLAHMVTQGNQMY